MANEKMSRMFGRKKGTSAAKPTPSAATTETRTPRDSFSATARPANRGSGIMTPGITRRSAGPLPTAQPAKPASVTKTANEGRTLVVGREISLAGEIKACDKLVVEGRVETDLTECKFLEIAGPGQFLGSATVDVCDIGGTFEGDLVVRDRLVLRASGLIRGNLRYRQLETERGGRLIGSADLLSDDAVALYGKRAAEALEAPAGESEEPGDPGSEPEAHTESSPRPSPDSNPGPESESPPAALAEPAQPRGIRELMERDSGDVFGREPR